MVDAVRAFSFGKIADDYHRYRPRTPAALLDWLVPPDARQVVDLAAGTGALTALLADRVPAVTAVEPDPGMRSVLATAAPAATVVDGTAEAIPLPDDSQDAVFVSSAWHWFDPPRAGPEIARVLHDGGRLGILGNGPDREVGWVAALREGTSGRPGEGRGRRQVTLPDGAAFTALERHEVRWTWSVPVDDLIGLLGTFSQVIVSGPDRQQALGRRARAVLAADPATRGRDVVDVPMLSVGWRADRLPR